jgi:hypothetical protein
MQNKTEKGKSKDSSKKAKELEIFRNFRLDILISISTLTVAGVTF